MEPRRTPPAFKVVIALISFLGITTGFRNFYGARNIADDEYYPAEKYRIEQDLLLDKEENHSLAFSSFEYIPGSAERYFMDNLVNLKYDSLEDPITCNVWTDPNATTPQVYKDLVAFTRDLEKHTAAIQAFENIPDLKKSIQEGSSPDVCEKVRLHPDGIQGLFPSNQLSHGNSGYLDPLLPPMRSHKMCFAKNPRSFLMSMDYLVHDFEAMCRKLKPTSNIIFIDMGASLEFHEEGETPALYILDLYEKFGFRFDHIYGFEMTPTDPGTVFGKLLPEKYMPSYHWINVGVSSEEGHKLNPLHSILKAYGEDDFIVVKLDIDTGSIEVPLAKQLLEDKDGVYHKLVDQFYFEHHVHLGELAYYWDEGMEGSIKESFDLFYGLREKGIPAHFWP